MHELSIAQALTALAEEVAREAGAGRIRAVRVQVGPLAGVVPEALRFAWPIAAGGTACEGAALELQPTPLVAHCERCRVDQTLSDASAYCCPSCGAPCGPLVSGRELDLVAVVVEDSDEAPHSGSSRAPAEEE